MLALVADELGMAGLSLRRRLGGGSWIVGTAAVGGAGCRDGEGDGRRRRRGGLGGWGCRTRLRRGGEWVGL